MRDGRRTAYAGCHCGLRFSFREVEAQDPHVPVVLTHLALPQPWIDDIRDARQAGASVEAIAARTELTVALVKRVLDGKANPFGQTEFAERRTAWEEILDGVDRRSRELARQAAKGLYRWLWNNDRAWLQADARNHAIRKPGQEQDWDQTDRKFCRAIEEAVETLRRDKDARLSLKTIVRKAGLPLGSFYNLPEKLPRSMAVIRDARETKEQSWHRRAHLVAEHLIDQGESVSIGRVRKAVGMMTSMTEAGLRPSFFADIVAQYNQ